MSTIEKIPPEILTEIVEILRESYSPFQLDKSVYSFAVTCRHFNRICESLLYSRYSNRNGIKSIRKLSKFVRLLILRPDRWPNFKFVSITWGYGISRVSLSRDQHMEMLANVPFLKTAIDRLPDELYRLQNRPDNETRAVETRQPCPTYVADLAKAFKRLLDVNISQNYLELLIFILTILSPYIQKLQIRMNNSGANVPDHHWRGQIFTVVGPPKYVSLEELHYVAVIARRSNPRGVIYTRLNAQLLDIFMKIPTLKKLKVDGFAFQSESLSHEVTNLRSCAVESLDLKYNFEVHFRNWRIFFPIFKKLKHFSYDGNSKDMFCDGRRVDSLVVPGFLDELMQGIFVHRDSLESLSLMGIHRSISDYTYRRILTAPVFTQFSCLKHMKMQLDLLIGWEGHSVHLRLHEILPNSLETLELWCQASLGCVTLTGELLWLKRHKEVVPSFALREVKFVHVIEIFQVGETWKIDMIKDFGENGIHLVFVGLPIEEFWRGR
ncbi:uncharacterized protein EAE97_004890 [Botrytis byssoidea]|uniref:F-box domain-containing protein n=1 Tax=Botrytis byssoidea TaxID=139641 RepID=A0A9P5ILF0_9HELO|nr:uncharacterized protein EAE97_004890 [Botrytis byssoidea]KAF7945852.1 hypothetical protein EAE97_004890 [Botrytis byssoidea]